MNTFEIVIVIGALFHSRARLIQWMILSTTIVVFIFDYLQVQYDFLGEPVWFELYYTMYILIMTIMCACAFSVRGEYFKWLTCCYGASAIACFLALLDHTFFIVNVYELMRVKMSTIECILAWIAASDSRRRWYGEN